MPKQRPNYKSYTCEIPPWVCLRTLAPPLCSSRFAAGNDRLHMHHTILIQCMLGDGGSNRCRQRVRAVLAMESVKSVGCSRVTWRRGEEPTCYQIGVQ